MKNMAIKSASWIGGIAFSVYVANGGLGWLPPWAAVPITILGGAVGLMADPDISGQFKQHPSPPVFLGKSGV
jgi:hypothetical protein